MRNRNKDGIYSVYSLFDYSYVEQPKNITLQKPNFKELVDGIISKKSEVETLKEQYLKKIDSYNYTAKDKIILPTEKSVWEFIDKFNVEFSNLHKTLKYECMKSVEPNKIYIAHEYTDVSDWDSYTFYTVNEFEDFLYSLDIQELYEDIVSMKVSKIFDNELFEIKMNRLKYSYYEKLNSALVTYNSNEILDRFDEREKIPVDCKFILTQHEINKLICDCDEKLAGNGQ